LPLREAKLAVGAFRIGGNWLKDEMTETFLWAAETGSPSGWRESAEFSILARFTTS